MKASSAIAFVVIAFAMLLALFAAYIGSYYTLLKGYRENRPMMVINGVNTPGPVLAMKPLYLLESPILNAVLFPAHWLDRQLRPGAWP